MKVTQEKLPASQIGLEIEIPPEKSKQAYEQVIANFARSANIPGFRKGKVPRQVLIQRLGVVRIKAAALEDLIESGLTEALKQEEVKAIGQPQLRTSFDELIDQYQPGNPLTFKAAVDVQPELNLTQYTGLQVQAEEVKYDPASVEKVIEENRQELATSIPVEGRTAQMNDVVVVDFKGVLVNDDPEAQVEDIPGGEATDFQVELHEGKFIEGFIDGIVGMNIGETKEVDAKFPSEYPQPEFADRKAKFTITLKELKEKELPEVNDEFAQEVSEFETLEELRVSLEKRFTEEADNKTKANQQQALTKELVKNVEVDLPETLINQEIDTMITQTAMQLSRQGIDVKKLFTQDTIPQLRERSRPEAIDSIKRTLALLEVAKRESIEVESVAIETRFTEVIAQYADKDVDQERLREVIADELLTEKILDWLQANASIELVAEGSLNKPEAEIEDDTAEETSAE
ncbi:MAG: trigger factor [Tatlockia sp.]|nr:trigger factor [Tatlockia sp.]